MTVRLALLALSLAACPPGHSGAPTVVSFQASHEALPTPGGEVTLTWVTADATKIMLNQEDVSQASAKTVSIKTDTVFTLTVSNSMGSATQKMTVYVKDPAFDQAPPCAIPDARKPGTRYTCGFEQMPHYSQVDPNLSYIQVPVATYAAEVAAGANVLSDGNPFYKSWLPLGPIPLDDNSIGYWFSVTCGATANAMALGAALAHKSADTQVVGGSWTDVSFVQAQKPSEQALIHQPLYTTHQPGAFQMDSAGLQRLVNMFTLGNAIPTPKGGWYTLVGTHYWPYYQSFEAIAGDFAAGSATYETLTTWSAVKGHSASISISNRKLRQVIDAGGTGSFHHSIWTAHVSGNDVTFTSTDESHYLALQGYTLATDAAGEETFFTNLQDPVYGVRDSIAFVDLAAGTQTKNGVTRNVALPSGDGNLLAWPIAADGGHPALASVFDLYDGEQVEIMDELYLIYVK